MSIKPNQLPVVTWGSTVHWLSEAWPTPILISKIRKQEFIWPPILRANATETTLLLRVEHGYKASQSMLTPSTGQISNNLVSSKMKKGHGGSRLSLARGVGQGSWSKKEQSFCRKGQLLWQWLFSVFYGKRSSLEFGVEKPMHWLAYYTSTVWAYWLDIEEDRCICSWKRKTEKLSGLCHIAALFPWPLLTRA